jgi:hypothetical protein
LNRVENEVSLPSPPPTSSYSVLESTARLSYIFTDFGRDNKKGMEEGGDINTRKEEEGVEMERKGGGYAQYLFLSVGANVAGGGSGCNGV